MKFRLEIDCDNAAFGDDPHSAVAAMLAEVRGKLAQQIDGGILRDINGNTVGRYWIEEGSEG